MSHDASAAAPGGTKLHEPDYMEDGRANQTTYGETGMSPTSPSPKKNSNEMEEGEKEDRPSTANRVTNVLALALLCAVFVASITCIAGGAAMLASIAPTGFKHFGLFRALGIVAVVVGCLCFAGSVGVFVYVALFAMGLRRYGMCCGMGTGCTKAFSIIVFGVIPVVALLLALAFTIIGFSFYSLSQQLPPYDKTYTEVEGITGPIYITRDALGLPHISASSRRDAYFGQGFAVAQDRLFQIEFHRLVGRGKLSSTVGTNGVDTDILLRTLNIRDSAIAACSLADPKELDFFQAFAEGINYFLRKESKRPPEFFFMSTNVLYFHDPEPFTAVDMCITSRLLQFQMSSNMDLEGQRMTLLLGTNRTAEEVSTLFQDQTGLPNTILNQEQMGIDDAMIEAALTAQATSFAYEAAVVNGLKNLYNQIVKSTEAASATVSGQAPEFVGIHERIDATLSGVMFDSFHSKSAQSIFANKFITASNAWAVRGSTGVAIGASDPHLTINLPSVWYYSHLTFPAADGSRYDIAGVGMVGLPGVHIGKSTYVSWGITMSLTDLEDLFVLPYRPDLGPMEYEYRDQVYSFVLRRERIKVKGKKDLVIDVKDSIIGPVISSIMGVSEKINIALWARALQRDDATSISGLLGLSDPAVRTAEDMIWVVKKLQSPGFSIPIADRDGGIGYAVSGLHPIRKPGHSGRFPMLASADFCFVSNDPNVPSPSVPMEDIPHLYSPNDGTPFHISAANQKIYPDGYAYPLGYDYVYPYRGARIQQMLNDATEEQLMDPMFHKKLQVDAQSNMWVMDFKAVIAAWPDSALNAAAQEWKARLDSWNGMADIGSVEAAFFWRWYQRCSVFPQDAIKALKLNYYGARQRYLIRSLVGPAPPNSSMECATAAGKEVSCMDFAISQFNELANTNFKERWGIDLNILSSLHEMVEKEAIGPMYKRYMQKSGDYSSVGVSGNSVDGNMDSHQAASQRSIYDWHTPGIMYFSFPGGNNGNPYSKYYYNLWETYSKNEYVEVNVMDNYTNGESLRVTRNILSP